MSPFIKPYVVVIGLGAVVVFILVAAPLDVASVLMLLAPVAFFIFAPLAIFSAIRSKYFRR